MLLTLRMNIPTNLALQGFRLDVGILENKRTMRVRLVNDEGRLLRKHHATKG